MTDLLKELEAVAGLCDKAGAMMPGEDGNAAIAEAETAATNWVITHHAEIAEASKDAEIGRAYLRWYASAKGYRNVIADSAHEAITIDALHNSAR